ncbi:hypothetical protein RCZAHN_87 [Rhodobacter phage RcZahn]|nr:hypothetical protein RCZAHN_87 [Rhodobacter phage RcZahn]
MNLFVTHTDPLEAAKGLDDKRVGKLLMEANQLLSMAVMCHVPKAEWGYLVGPGMLTFPSHEKHPVSLWVQQSKAHYWWTLRHALALGWEFEYRFGKDHMSAERTRFILRQKYHYAMPDHGPIVEFQNSARNTHVDCTTLAVPQSYRVYLNARWFMDKNPVKFTRRKPPVWAHKEHIEP